MVFIRRLPIVFIFILKPLRSSCLPGIRLSFKTPVRICMYYQR